MGRASFYGVETLGDAELVAVVLGNCRHPAIVVSTALLAESNGISGLSRIGVANLTNVGRRQGLRLAAALELGRRASARAVEEVPCLVDSGVVADWGRSQLGHLDHEELWMLAIDGQRRLRSAKCVAKGGLHGLQLHVRDPLRVAIREGASAIVLVHNHPSGDPSPSPQDIEFTLRLMAACEVVATPLVDHVIVARDRHSSMLARGLLDSQNNAS
jgi:DNA repair protein RadC